MFAGRLGIIGQRATAEHPQLAFFTAQLSLELGPITDYREDFIARHTGNRNTFRFEVSGTTKANIAAKAIFKQLGQRHGRLRALS
jgi:hypothetical protein